MTIFAWNVNTLQVQKVYELSTLDFIRAKPNTIGNPGTPFA